MAKSKKPSQEETSKEVVEQVTPLETPETPVHPLQKFMDNPWLLLLLGILVPILSYTIWGLIEIWSMSPAKLP